MKTVNYKKGYLCIISALIYYLILRIIYSQFITKYWAYAGLYKDGTHINIVWVILLLLPSLLFLGYASSKNDLSYQIISILILISFFPAIIMAEFRKTDFLILLIVYYYWLMILTCLIKPIKLKRPPIPQQFFENLIIIIFAVVIVYIWIKYADMHIQKSLFNVFEQREIASGYSYPRPIAYVFSISKALLPFFLVYELDKKRYFMSVFIFGVGLLSFCIDASKSSLFMLVVAVVGYYLIKVFKSSMLMLSGGMIIGGIIAMLENKILSTYYILAYLFRRTCFVPTKLNYDYYNLFCDREKIYFKDSIEIFGELPYSSVANLVGIYNGTGAHSNNGLFSDAYYNLGILGMIIMPLAVVLLLKLLDECAVGLKDEVTFVVVLQFVLHLVSSPLLRNLLSHGFVAIIIVLFFINRKQTSQNEESFS